MADPKTEQKTSDVEKTTGSLDKLLDRAEIAAKIATRQTKPIDYGEVTLMIDEAAAVMGDRLLTTFEREQLDATRETGWQETRFENFSIVTPGSKEITDKMATVVHQVESLFGLNFDPKDPPTIIVLAPGVNMDFGQLKGYFDSDHNRVIVPEKVVETYGVHEVVHALRDSWRKAKGFPRDYTSMLIDEGQANYCMDLVSSRDNEFQQKGILPWAEIRPKVAMPDWNQHNSWPFGSDKTFGPLLVELLVQEGGLGALRKMMDSEATVYQANPEASEADLAGIIRGSCRNYEDFRQKWANFLNLSETPQQN